MDIGHRMTVKAARQKSDISKIEEVQSYKISSRYGETAIIRTRSPAGAGIANRPLVFLGFF